MPRSRSSLALQWYRGNRGDGLRCYASMMPSGSRKRAILALHAFFDSLRSAAAEDAFYESADLEAAMAHFADHATQLARAVDIDAVRAMQNSTTATKANRRSNEPIADGAWSTVSLCP